MKKDKAEARVVAEAQGEPAPETTPEPTLEPLVARVSELEEVLKAETSKSEDYFRRLQYLQADFENYRKRTEKEMS